MPQQVGTSSHQWTKPVDKFCPALPGSIFPTIFPCHTVHAGCPPSRSPLAERCNRSSKGATAALKYKLLFASPDNECFGIPETASHIASCWKEIRASDSTETSPQNRINQSGLRLFPRVGCGGGIASDKKNLWKKSRYETVPHRIGKLRLQFALSAAAVPCLGSFGLFGLAQLIGQIRKCL